MRRQKDRLLDPLEQAFEALAPLPERKLAEVGVPFGQDVESDEPRRSRFAQHADSRVRRVDALLKGAKVQPVFRHDDNLSIQHELRLAQAAKGRQQLGEVTGHRTGAPADQRDLVAVPKDERPETVPFRLVLPAVALGDARLGGGGQHRLHVERNGQFHASCPQLSISCGWGYTVLPYRRPVSRP